MGRKKKEIKNDYIQLDLIPPTQAEKLYKEFINVKESTDKVRKGVFAKHTELSKKVQDLTCQIESLQKQMIVMSEWIIRQLGLVDHAQKAQDGSLGETTSLRITSINAAYAEKLHPSHISEISDMNILSA